MSSCSDKDIYCTINSLLNKSKSDLSFHDSPSGLSTQFCNYFVDEIQNIRDELDDAHIVPVTFKENICDGVKILEAFRPASQDEIRTVISRCPSKSSKLDPLPTWFVKDYIDQLLPVLTELVNSSLSCGVFPQKAHHAIIRPLFKSPSLDKNNLKNYRPVSNLSFVGKLIEKIACSRLVEHMEINNLADPYQSAYRPKHGTESALIKVKNDIMFSLNSNKVVLVVLVDLSAAFDTIDHNIFICRLSNRIGVMGIALNWFQSYLEGWSAQVYIDGELSDPTTSRFGLPQGSVVGPTGFRVYILPAGDIARYHKVSYHVYADDIQLYVAFDPKIPGALDKAMFSLQSCISDIRNWLTANELRLNDNKT